MSTKKCKKDILELLITRLKEHYNVSYDSELAKILAIDQGNFSAKKKSGSLIKDICLFCFLEGLDCNEIFYGKVGYYHPIAKKFDNWLLTKSKIPEHNEIWFNIDKKKNFEEFIEWLGNN